MMAIFIYHLKPDHEKSGLFSLDIRSHFITALFSTIQTPGFQAPTVVWVVEIVYFERNEALKSKF